MELESDPRIIVTGDKENRRRIAELLAGALANCSGAEQESVAEPAPTHFVDEAPEFNYSGKTYKYRDAYHRKGVIRNRRCPCGSRLKFKHCCINRKKGEPCN